VARRAGYRDIRTFVPTRVGQGASLASISREAGLHKDWLSRHLADVDLEAAAAVRAPRPGRWDARWRPAVHRLGFADVAGYLRDRHVGQHLTVSAIAAEVGLSRHVVTSALRRHGLDMTAHAAKRHAASQRAAEVAAGLGFGQHRRLPDRAPGRGLDLAGDRHRIRPAPVLGLPPGRVRRPHHPRPLTGVTPARPGHLGAVFMIR
jgi:AraC-like DNA-binding protein